MRKRTRLSAFTLVPGLTAILLSAGVSATGFDGEASLVCATTDVVSCVDGPACLQGSSSDFDLPSFLFVDFKNKVVRATDESGYREVSPINNFEKTQKQMIIQGVENHRAWSLAIDRRSGHMSVTSAGPDVSFMIFGACTAI